MGKSYNKNNRHMSGTQNINSGNQFSFINSGNNSPITVELHNSGSNMQTTFTYETEPADLEKLTSEKLRELVLPAILAITDILLWAADKYLVSESPWNIVLPTSMVVLFVVIIALVVCTVKDYLRVLRLQKVGQVGYYIPKGHAISQLFKMIFSLMSGEDSHVSSEIGVSRVFKNEEGVIFEVKGCKCPYCQSTPIGYMRPRKKVSNSIEFICDQNSDHTIKFDWKKTVLK